VKDFGAAFTGEKGPAEGATRHGYTASPIVDGDHLLAETGGKDAAVTCFEEMRSLVGSSYAQPMKELEASLDRLDFESARAQLAEIESQLPREQAS